MIGDTRLVLRSLWRRPTLALTAVVSLGLAIGANATVFSVVNALLFRPLPYAAPEGLVAVWPEHFLANREVAAIRSRARSYEQIAAFSPGWLMALTGVTTPRQLSAARVSGNFFDLLGVPPLIGRTFGMESEKPGQDQRAVLSYELWQSSFAADPRVLGRPIRLEGTSHTVVAVMPRGFRTFDAETDLWTALPMDPNEATWRGAMAAGYGRLRPGVTTQAATAELQGLVTWMRGEFELGPAWVQGAVVVGLQESLVGGVRSTLLVLLCAVAFLLLVAIANVANLLLVRTEERRHDLAVRAALGASPRALAGLVLGESLVLGVLGGGLGVTLAYAGVGLLRSILPPDLPRLPEVGVDGQVLGVAAGLTLLATMLFGLAPALRGSAAGLGFRLRAGRTIAGGGERTRGTIVALEVALALIAIGIYGVVAYGVRQRLREIGVRVALGADPWSIRRLVVGQGLGYATLGVAVGVPAALALARLMRGLVFGVPTTDPLSFTVVPLTLVSIATAASWFPARKAAATDPTQILRE